MRQARVVIQGLLLASLGLAGLSAAHDRDAGPQVVPDAERVLAPGQTLAGPTRNEGIESVTPIGTVALEGEIVEHRSDQPRPQVRKPGDAAFEKTGMTHGWENRSPGRVRARVVDSVPDEIKK